MKGKSPHRAMLHAFRNCQIVVQHRATNIPSTFFMGYFTLTPILPTFSLLHLMTIPTLDVVRRWWIYTYHYHLLKHPYSSSLIFCSRINASFTCFLICCVFTYTLFISCSHLLMLVCEDHYFSYAYTLNAK